MDASDAHEAVKAGRAMHRRLHELAETQRWVHHVADLDSGKIVTTPLDRPITPLSRAERLSQLGHPFDPAVFGGPSQRLTPSQGYQPSPEAWLEAVNASLYSHQGGEPGLVWWEELPQQFDDFFGMFFFFAVPPVGPSVASISLYAQPWHGDGGDVHLRASGPEGPVTEVFVPIDPGYGEHVVDFTFVSPAAPQPLDIVMDVHPGVRYMGFKEISLAAQPPWVEPGPLIE
jgi:hypothetical protein